MSIYNIGDKIRIIINHLFIFSTINDNFVVENFGGSSLKVILLAFVIFNINKVLAFRGWSKCNLPFICVIISMCISLIVNSMFYDDIITKALNPLISVSVIFIVLSQEKKPIEYIWGFVFSALFSSFLCLTTTNTISLYTFRKTGGTGDPNEFSMTVLIPLFYLLPLILKRQHLFIKSITVLCIFVYVAALIYAGSKSAVITFTLSLFTFIGYVLFRKHDSTNKIFVVFGVTIIMIAFLFIINNLYNETINLLLDRFSSNKTADSRIKSWSVGIELFRQNPFFGIGVGNYSNMVGQMMESLVQGSRAAHNMYIQVATETGIIGLLSFLWCLFTIIYRQLKYKFLPVELIFAYVPFLIMGATLSLFLQKYIWVFIALLYNQSFQISEQK